MSEESGNSKRSVRHLKQLTKFPMKELGIVADVRPISMAVYIAENKVPGALLSKMAGAHGARASVVVTGEDLPEMMHFGLALMKDSFDWPRIVDDADSESDDELAPAHIPIADLNDFLTHALGGRSVQTTSGEVSGEALASFRDVREPSDGSPSSGEVQPKAEPDDRDS